MPFGNESVGRAAGIAQQLWVYFRHLIFLDALAVTSINSNKYFAITTNRFFYFIEQRTKFIIYQMKLSDIFTIHFSGITASIVGYYGLVKLFAISFVSVFIADWLSMPGKMEIHLVARFAPGG